MAAFGCTTPVGSGGVGVRYFLFTGLAESEDGGESFVRASRVPVLDRSDEELHVRSSGARPARRRQLADVVRRGVRVARIRSLGAPALPAPTSVVPERDRLAAYRNGVPRTA